MCVTGHPLVQRLGLQNCFEPEHGPSCILPLKRLYSIQGVKSNVHLRAKTLLLLSHSDRVLPHSNQIDHNTQYQKKPPFLLSLLSLSLSLPSTNPRIFFFSFINSFPPGYRLRSHHLPPKPATPQSPSTLPFPPFPFGLSSPTSTQTGSLFPGNMHACIVARSHYTFKNTKDLRTP